MATTPLIRVPRENKGGGRGYDSTLGLRLTTACPPLFPHPNVLTPKASTRSGTLSSVLIWLFTRETKGTLTPGSSKPTTS